MNCKCPNCGSANDQFTAINGGNHTPNEGDYAVCYFCGQIMIFDENLNMAEPTLEQMADAKIADPEEYELVIEASRAVIKHNRHGRT